MNTTSSPTIWRENLEALRQVLVTAQAERSKRQEWVASEDGTPGELGWVLFEREQMLQAVNDLRTRAGKTPVSAEQVTQAEQRAMGHVDYTTKFAIACADLVAGD